MTGDRFARIVTEALAPSVLVLCLPLLLAWHSTHTIGGTLLWGSIVGVTSSVIPMSVIIYGARRGMWDGHHVRDRTGRVVPFVVLIVSTLAGLTLLLLAGAPWAMSALQLTMLTMLLIAFAITWWWKISIHSAVASGALVILVVTFSPVLWALGVLVALVAWSRVRLNDHTPAQVVAGTLLGAVLGGGMYILLH